MTLSARDWAHWQQIQSFGSSVPRITASRCPWTSQRAV